MASQRTDLLWAILSLVALLCGMAQAAGPSIPIKYCARANTGFDVNPNMFPLITDFQSEGRCFGNCTTAKKAFAIVLEKACWCSNLIPNKADQANIKDCNFPCPGYPDDLCGGNGVYGYLEISQFRPSGTASAGMGIIETEEPSAPTPASMTTEMTIETEVMQSSVRSTVTSPSSTSTSDSTASNSFSSSGPPQSVTQRPTVETVTVGGTVRTVTTTPQATAGHDTGLQEASASKGLAGGAIAGIVVGVIGGLLVLAAFIFLLWKKRRQEDGEKGFVSPMRGGSSSGMTGISKGPMVTTDPLGWEAKRRSHLMPVDPRLDPFAKGIYSHDPNRSHDSISSLQDNHDYSRRVTEAPRVLRAVNPDPDIH